jgi:hypothetical protein
MQEKYQENQAKLKQLAFQRETSPSSRSLNRKFLHYYHKAMENFIKPQSNSNTNSLGDYQKDGKLNVLESEINSLELEISQQKELFLHQNERLIQNFNQFFERINQAFSKEINQFAADQAEYHRKCCEIWSAFEGSHTKEQ